MNYRNKMMLPADDVPVEVWRQWARDQKSYKDDETDEEIVRNNKVVLRLLNAKRNKVKGVHEEETC